MGALVFVRIRQNVFLSPYVRMIAGGSCREGGGEAQVLGATGGGGGGGRAGGSCYSSLWPGA